MSSHSVEAVVGMVLQVEGVRLEGWNSARAGRKVGGRVSVVSPRSVEDNVTDVGLECL